MQADALNGTDRGWAKKCCDSWEKEAHERVREKRVYMRREAERMKYTAVRWKKRETEERIEIVRSCLRIWHM